MLQHLDDPMPLAPATDEHREVVLARVTTLRRRRRTALVAAPTLMAAAAIVAVGWIGYGRLDASPAPLIPGSPTPSPTISVPDCATNPANYSRIPCPTSLPPGSYTSDQLAGPPSVSYQLTIPEGWGVPEPGVGILVDGNVLDLGSVDRTSGLRLAVSPFLWVRATNNSYVTTDAPVGAKALAAALARRAGVGAPSPSLVDARQAWSVELRTMPDRFRLECPAVRGCSPVLATPSKLGNFGLQDFAGPMVGPSRVVTFDLVTGKGSQTVAVWLWSKVPGGSAVSLRQAQGILDSLQVASP